MIMDVQDKVVTDGRMENKAGVNDNKRHELKKKKNGE